MQILLLSMPDSFEHTPAITIRIPNGALASLAGNIDAHHRVGIADLILAQSSVRPTVERLMRGLQPDVVGLSVMTFQRSTARRMDLARAFDEAGRARRRGRLQSEPRARGLDGSRPRCGLHRSRRRRGDVPRAASRPGEQATSPTCPASGFARVPDSPLLNAARPVARGGRRGTSCRIAARASSPATRYSAGPSMSSRRPAAVRFDCSFCSIIEMRGRNFHRFSDRAQVIDDIADAHARGARAIFLVDDNITLDVGRFKSLCRAIVRAGLHHIDYLVQGDDPAPSRRMAKSWRP